MAVGLTPDQVNAALGQLSDATKFRIWPLVVETVLFSFFTVLIVVSTSILLSKGAGSWPVRAMLGLTFIGYVLAALDWASDIKTLWNVMNIFLPKLLSTSIKSSQDADIALAVQVNVWVAITEITSTYNIMISDAVALWRALVGWERHRAIVVPSIVVLLCLVGIGITNTLMVAALNIPSAPASLDPLLKQAEVIAMLFCSMSAFINLYSMALIAYKAWVHRRDIQRFLQKGMTRQTVEGVLTLMVESGLMYSLFMVVYILTVILSFTLDEAFNFHWSAVMNQVAGMYPTLVIVIVMLKKSHCEHQFSYADNVGLDVAGTLPFAARTWQTWTGTSAHPVSLQLSVAQDLSKPDISEERIDGSEKMQAEESDGL
ncbi:hypothetical protein OF83DRAFT_1172805 [Amylostereum chailletii]|nr:hypothetical protein OF83DRAFT_1172805 [Amylostereum chailletii]